MTDDLDALRAALKSAPAAEPEAKARAMALAMENFDRLHADAQGSADGARSSQDRPKGAAPLTGVRRMLTFLTSRPALATTTSIAALAIGVAVILPVADLRLPSGSMPVEATRTEAPRPTVAATPAPAEDAVADGAPGALDAPAQANAKTAAPASMAGSPEQEATASAVASEPALAPPPMTAFGTIEALPAAPPVAMEEALAMDDARQRSESDVALDQFAEPMVAPPPEMMQAQPPETTEAYANEPPNPVKVTAEEPVSTFSIDVDTASWAVDPVDAEHGRAADPPIGTGRGDGELFPLRLPRTHARAGLCDQCCRHGDALEPGHPAGDHRHPGRAACGKRPPAPEPRLPDRHLWLDGGRQQAAASEAVAGADAVGTPARGSGGDCHLCRIGRAGAAADRRRRPGDDPGGARQPRGRRLHRRGGGVGTGLPGGRRDESGRRGQPHPSGHGR